MSDGFPRDGAKLTDGAASMRDAVLALRAEVNCRIEHGADSGGHLEYVQKRLDGILLEGGAEYRSRFIVLERPEGSKCWTLASKNEVGGMLKATFSTRTRAEEWVRDVHSKRLGWWRGVPDQLPMQAHIAEVRLPE